MRYRDAIYFIGKCLGLGIHPERADEIRDIIKSGSISWEKLVWVSSRQMVLPALYVRLRDAELLDELPSDLVEHLENIHRVNVKRNRIILEQIKDIVKLLNKNGIDPVFLKGTAHLLEDLYKDIGERMIGDIDILLPLEQILPAVELLGKIGYSFPVPMEMDDLKMIKHYPRLRNDKAVAALEIHRQPVSPPYDKRFSFTLIEPERKKLDYSGKAYVLSDPHQVIHNILNAQLNDRAFRGRKIFLRQMYDLLLLSQRVSTQEVIDEFGNFSKQLNANLATASQVMGNSSFLTFNNTKFTRKYFRQVDSYMRYPRLHYFIRTLNFLGLRLSRYITRAIRSIYIREERRALFKRMGKRSWYWKHVTSYKRIRNV